MKIGLLKPICIGFYDSSALKTLYFSLVRSQIKYATLIWLGYGTLTILDNIHAFP